MVELNEASRRAAALIAGPRGREVTAAVARLVEPLLVMPHEMTDEAGKALLIEQLARLDVQKIAALDDPLELVDALGTSVDSLATGKNRSSTTRRSPTLR